MKSGLLSDLVKNNQKFKDNIYLTFDFDWASEDVLEYLFNFLDRKNLKATLFVTHQSEVAQKHYNNPNYEFCIHPNFNFLVQGDHRYGSNISEILDYYEKILPFKPMGMRSHDSFIKTSLIKELSIRKYLYESNILLNTNINIKPFKNWTDNLLQIPILWEDDQWCNSNVKTSVKDILNYNYLKVLNFHPIHIFLNSYNLEIYNSIKTQQGDLTLISSKRNILEYGVFNFLEEVTCEL